MQTDIGAAALLIGGNARIPESQNPRSTVVAVCSRAGGVAANITGLGLAGYFPEEKEVSREKVDTSEQVAPKSRKLVKVRPELLACLCGMDTRPTVQDELIKKLETTDSAVDLLAAGATLL